MINLIYLCFNANPDEKKEIYKVLISSEEITNFCQESVKSRSSLELNEKLKGSDIFNNKEMFYNKLLCIKKDKELQKKEFTNKNSEKIPNYMNALKIINKYFIN